MSLIDHAVNQPCDFLLYTLILLCVPIVALYPHTPFLPIALESASSGPEDDADDELTSLPPASKFILKLWSEMVSSLQAQTYSGLLAFAALAVVLCVALAGLAYLLSLTASQDTEKRSEYECGFAPFDSATRHPFEVHFYVVGILFLIFDVEIALLFP